MNFGSVLHQAQKNEKSGSNGIRYYSTKYEPPKKEQRSKQLSVNVKKFLEKKEREEREKLEEERRKKEKLLALRAQDKKSTRRMNVMLKRTKSANQSVLQDAVDKDNTAVTLAGPLQPDEDDYGYVSQESSAMFAKMMEKYSKIPDEKKYDFTKKKVSTNLKNTKDRVKAALDKEKEDALLPHKRKRKHKDSDGDDGDMGDYRSDKEEKPKPKPRPMAPPPLNFQDLLKIAEKKQFEPIIIEQKPKEEERLLTKKQKREMEMEKQWKERKEARDSEAPPPKIPKLNGAKPSDKIPKLNEKSANPKPVSKPLGPKHEPYIPERKPIKPLPTNGSSKTPLKTQSNSNVYTPTSLSTTLKNKEYEMKKKMMLKNDKLKSDPNSKSLPPKKPSAEGLKPKKTIEKPKEFPPKDLKPKQFPPADIRRGPPVKKKPIVRKGRFYDDDDDEYDSEMDDFIDDGPEEGNDYSKYISEIFGYDKSKYRDIDDDVDNMESSFAQQMREEVISTKIGIMEDLEDIKKEEEEKKRKAMMKKKMMRR